jgi:hypothetical protein
MSGHVAPLEAAEEEKEEWEVGNAGAVGAGARGGFRRGWWVEDLEQEETAEEAEGRASYLKDEAERVAGDREVAVVWGDIDFTLFSSRTLKDICRDKQVKVSGTKAEMVSRLQEWGLGEKDDGGMEEEEEGHNEHNEQEEQQEREKELEEEVAREEMGAQRVADDVYKGLTWEDSDLAAFTISQLQDICRRKQLIHSGTKAELVRRLAQAALRQKERERVEDEMSVSLGAMGDNSVDDDHVQTGCAGGRHPVYEDAQEEYLSARIYIH